MSTISGFSTSGGYLSSLFAPNANTSPVAQTTNPGLVNSAVSLSFEGSMVSTLLGGSSSSLTNNAAGLLNSFEQAGTASSAQTTGNSLSSNATASGIYNATGSLQGLPSSTTANWSNALKADPNLASLVAADSVNQGIVGSLLSTVA